MKCKWVQDRLLLYLAEELGRKEAAQVVAHLERCEICTALLEEVAESRDTLKDMVRTTAQPPASLDARIMERVQALPRRRFPLSIPMPLWNTRTTLAFSACAVLLLQIGFQWGRWSRSPLPGKTVETMSARPMLDLAALADTHLAWDSKAVTTVQDRKTLAERLSQKTGLHVTPLEMKESELQLKDGGVLQMSQVPVATMHYNWKGTPVMLAQADGMRLAPPSTLQEMRDHGRCFLIQHSGDLTYVLWCEGTNNFVLVARVPPAQLFALACDVCAKLQRAG